MYTAVTVPTRSGNACLTTTGTSTLPMAIPPAATNVPASSTADPPTTRRMSPAVSTARASPTALFSPSRRASSGTAAAATPKQMVGTAVSTLAHSSEAPSEVRTSPSNGPTLVIAGRRLAAASQPLSAAAPETF